MLYFLLTFCFEIINWPDYRCQDWKKIAAFKITSVDSPGICHVGCSVGKMCTDNIHGG